MNKPDLTYVVKVKISVLLPDGKRWDIVPVDPILKEMVRNDLEYLVNNFIDEKRVKIKIDGPYSAKVDPVKIAGVPE